MVTKLGGALVVVIVVVVVVWIFPLDVKPSLLWAHLPASPASLLGVDIIPVKTIKTLVEQTLDPFIAVVTRLTDGRVKVEWC